MSFQTIRAYIETSVNDAFTALTKPVPVVFDSVGGEPPGTEYVQLTIVYNTFSEPILCLEENGIEAISGTIQMAIYSPRGNGMARLEELGAVAMNVINKLRKNGFSAGAALGPVHVLSGDDPLALSNVSAPFMARG